MKYRVRFLWLPILLALLLARQHVQAEEQRPVFLYSRYFNAKGEDRYLPEGTYSEVLTRLRETFEVRVHDRPLTAKTLKGVAVVMIANPSDKVVGDYPPPPHCSAKDVAALTRYVRAGGGLIVLGNQEDHNLEITSMNKLLGNFGMQFENEYTDAKALRLPPNALLLGGQLWAYYTGNALRLRPDHPAYPQAIATNDLSQKPVVGTRDHAGVLMAGATLGKGRVIAVTDAGWLTNDALSGKGIGGVAITEHNNWEIMERLSAWVKAGPNAPLDF